MTYRFSLFVLGLVLFAPCTELFAEGDDRFTVQTATKGSTLKLDGRLFVGLCGSEKDGAFSNVSLDIPDAKLRFTFQPAPSVSLVKRFSTNRAGVSTFDYFFLQYQFRIGNLRNQLLRIGKFKVDIGEETWTDNPVENILITNSAGGFSGYDEGICWLGNVERDQRPVFLYSATVANGTKDFTTSASGLASSVKGAVAPHPQVYVSATFYATGTLDSVGNGAGRTLAATDARIGGLQSAPSNATSWKRTVWEVDARWNYGSKGVKPNIGDDATVPAQVAAALGRFNDDAEGSADRTGTFWYGEVLVNATQKLFLAFRYSSLKLDGDAKARLVDSPVDVNEYTRLSLGVGYRFTHNVHGKIEGTQNDVSGATTTPELSQVMAGVALKF